MIEDLRRSGMLSKEKRSIGDNLPIGTTDLSRITFESFQDYSSVELRFCRVKRSRADNYGSTRCGSDGFISRPLDQTAECWIWHEEKVFCVNTKTAFANTEPELSSR